MLLFFLVVFPFLTGLFVVNANAIIINLTQNQIKEAIDYGKKRNLILLGDFSDSWSVRLSKKEGWATLYTGYHNLAFKARKASIENYELSKQKIAEALAISDLLTFTISIFGDSIDFAQEYHASLRVNGKMISPVFEYAPEYAEPSEFWPEMPDHVAGCVAKFPLDGISPTSKVTLIMKPFDGDVLEYDFDLSRMK